MRANFAPHICLIGAKEVRLVISQQRQMAFIILKMWLK